MVIESIELVGRAKLIETLRAVTEQRDGIVHMFDGDELEGGEIGALGRQVELLDAAEELGNHILSGESGAEGNNMARLIESGK